MSLDYTELVNFSLIQWAKDKRVLSLFLVLFVVTSVIGVLTIYQVADDLSNTSELVKNSMNENITSEADIVALQQPPSSFNLGVSILSLIIGLITTYLTYLAVKMALLQKKMKTVKIEIINFIVLIILEIITGLAVLFSVFDLKKLWIAIVGIVLMIASIFYLPLIVLAIIALIIYGIIIVRNAMRLSVTVPAFIEGKEFVESMNHSWEITNGNALNIFLGAIIYTIISVIVSAIFGIFILLYLIPFYIGVLQMLITNPANAGTIFDLVVTMLRDPFFNVAIVIATIASAWSIIFDQFFKVGVYAQLKNKKSRK